MTVKRDLKRRVRQRQARTGEAYVTARRHVVAAGADDGDAGDADRPDPDPGDRERDATPSRGEPSAADPGAADPAIVGAPGSDPAVDDDDDDTAADDDEAAETFEGAFPVVEVVDVTAEAKGLGLRCRVTMFPSLIERIDPAVALVRLRDLLVTTADDPQMLLMSRVALLGVAPGPPAQRVRSIDDLRRLVRRARAGMGGVSEGGSAVAFHAAGRDGIVPILCVLGWPDSSLTLSAIDDLTAEAAGLDLRIARVPWAMAGRLGSFRAGRPGPVAPAPMLFVIHDGRRYPITRDEFLIGSNSRDAHLAIKDGLVSRHHAAVICRGGVHYLKDLDSTHGVYYKGMRIDNKRIDDGDVFQIGDQSLRFTYQSDDGL